MQLLNFCFHIRGKESLRSEYFNALDKNATILVELVFRLEIPTKDKV